MPASFNDIGVGLRDYVGVVWYQTTVRVPQGWDGQRIVLRFESATHRATVWVDDVEVMSHEGGYTPFETDVTEFVASGQQIRISAVVANRLSFQSIDVIGRPGLRDRPLQWQTEGRDLHQEACLQGLVRGDPHGDAA